MKNARSEPAQEINPACRKSGEILDLMEKADGEEDTNLALLRSSPLSSSGSLFKLGRVQAVIEAFLIHEAAVCALFDHIAVF